MYVCMYVLSYPPKVTRNRATEIFFGTLSEIIEEYDLGNFCPQPGKCDLGRV